MKLRFGSEISHSFGVYKVKNALLPVVEVRKMSSSNADSSFPCILAWSGVWVFI